jgi:hypothetical protein
MADIEIVRASCIVIGVVVAAMLIMTCIGPVADEADYGMYLEDNGQLPGIVSTGHTLHTWFYSLIWGVVLLTLVWYIKLIFTKMTYNRHQTWGGQW